MLAEVLIIREDGLVVFSKQYKSPRLEAKPGEIDDFLTVITDKINHLSLSEVVFEKSRLLFYSYVIESLGISVVLVLDNFSGDHSQQYNREFFKALSEEIADSLEGTFFDLHGLSLLDDYEEFERSLDEIVTRRGSHLGDQGAWSTHA